MINLLINSFAPVAILILIGYISAKKSIFSKENSIAIIKYVGVVAVPALTLKIILSISISNVNWTLIFSYVFSELIIYVTALLIGKYIFNINSREMFLKNNKLKLTEKEVSSIIYLFKAKKPVKIQELQSKVWGYQSQLETHTVETHIYRLRKKILDKFMDENFILNNKDGYFL